jgi:hypothetical protein
MRRNGDRVRPDHPQRVRLDQAIFVNRRIRADFLLSVCEEERRVPTIQDYADCAGCSIFFRISSQTDLTSAVITDACSMRSKISFASSRYFCAVSWT